MAKPWSAAKAAARIAEAEGFDAGWIAEKSARILANCHPRQRAFVEDTHRRVSALVGRRGGKTTGQRARFLLRMLGTPRARCAYIALTRKSAEELMWGGLKDVLARLGVAATFNETKLRCTLARNGSVLTLVGADDKKEVDKLRGQKFHEVAIDEAASFPAPLLENLIDRVVGPTLGDYRGVLTMFGTPGQYLQGAFYEATMPGGDKHRRFDDRGLPEYANWTSWSSHTWTLLDGAATVPAMKNAWDEALVMKADKAWSDDHPIWSREWLGRWAADDTENVFKFRAFVDGQPWNQWDPERVGPMRFGKLPDRDGKPVHDWEYGFGMDLGHNDPFTLEVFAVSPSDPTRTLYHVFEFVQRGMYAKTVAELLIGKKLNHDRPDGVIGVTGWPAGMVADLAGLGDSFLDELRNVYGIAVAPAEKGHKYKVPAIELFNGDLVDGRIKVLKGSQLAQEMVELQWVADEYGRLTENRTQRNDASDAAVYARILIAHLFETGMLAAVSPTSGAITAVSSLEDEPAVSEIDDDLFEARMADDVLSDDLFG